MKPVQIAGFNNVLTAPPNWDKEKYGECVDLPIRAVADQYGLVQLMSAWLPSHADLLKLKEGAPIILTLIGRMHPPVWIDVGSKKDIQSKIIQVKPTIIDPQGNVVQSNGNHTDQSNDNENDQ